MGVLDFLSNRGKDKNYEDFFPTQEELNQKGFEYNLQQLKSSQLVTYKIWSQEGFENNKDNKYFLNFTKKPKKENKKIFRKAVQGGLDAIVNHFKEKQKFEMEKLGSEDEENLLIYKLKDDFSSKEGFLLRENYSEELAFTLIITFDKGKYSHKDFMALRNLIIEKIKKT